MSRKVYSAILFMRGYVEDCFFSTSHMRANQRFRAMLESLGLTKGEVQDAVREQIYANELDEVYVHMIKKDLK